MTEPVVSDLAQWQIAVRYQLRAYLRTYRFLVLFALVVAVQLLGFVVLYHYVGPAQVASGGDVGGFLSGLFSFLTDFVYLSAALLGGDAISTDFSGRTGYYILPLPIRRRILLLGRYTAAAATTLLIAALYIFGATLIAQYFFGTVPVAALLESSLLAFLFVGAAMALAFFFSSLVKSPMLSILLTVLVLLIALPIVTSIVASTAGVAPWFSLEFAGEAIVQPITGVPLAAGTATG
ncbi:MAG: ABC transporter permease, partial [Thermoplasmata archaeon]